ncbi:MAG: AAA family ATPase [Bacteroidales bacterium]|nr:AAA family ATPase [Bacteroidales bacterium]
MKQLKIKNFGPISEAELDLDRIAVIIGMQSSGKSSLLKMACYCSWVEKRIQLAQSDKMFQEPDAFRDFFVSYYGLNGYFNRDTFVEYSSPYLSFSYKHHVFSFYKKPNIWNFRRPKIQYIPSERNIASFIPKWKKIPVRDGLLEFLSEWDSARQIIPVEDNILQLGISYSYDITSDTDNIITADGNPLPLSDSSSGLQSLVPLYLLIDCLHSVQDNKQAQKKELTLEQRAERDFLINAIYKKIIPKPIHLYFHQGNVDKEKQDVELVLEGKTYTFFNERESTIFKNRYTRFLYTDHSELFLEEPEQNLYPPTQSQLVDWLCEKVFDSKRENTLLVSTHSPYILNEMCKQYRKGMNMYFTYRDKDNSTRYSLKKLTEEEVNEIYTSGTDLFFNSAAFV